VEWSKPELVFALLSFCAALASAFSAWYGPIKAAHLAEQMRQKYNQENDNKNKKKEIFATLMRHRSSWTDSDAVGAFNSIDFIFQDSTTVRQAWSSMFDALDKKPYDGNVAHNKFQHLIQEMAKDIGLSENLNLVDLQRVYYPEVWQNRKS